MHLELERKNSDVKSIREKNDFNENRIAYFSQLDKNVAFVKVNHHKINNVEL